MAYPVKPVFGWDGERLMVQAEGVVNAVASISNPGESKRAMIAHGSFSIPDSEDEAGMPVECTFTVFRQTPYAAEAKAVDKAAKAVAALNPAAIAALKAKLGMK